MEAQTIQRRCQEDVTVLRLVSVNLLESSNSQFTEAAAQHDEPRRGMLGDIATCLSDVTSLAPEWQP